MKKITIALLAILMLFAFVACDNSVKPTGTPISTFSELQEAVAKDGSYYLANDINLDSQLNISAKVTLDGNNHVLSMKTPTTAAYVGDKALVLITSEGTVLKNLTVEGTSESGEDWNSGEYGIKVYNAKNVVLENITVTAINAGIQVNSSEVTLKGTITVSGNVFGGIEVSKSGDEGLTAATLIVDGNVVCTDTETPAIWIDGLTVGNTVTDNSDKLISFTPSSNSDQTWYITEYQKSNGTWNGLGEN